MLGGTLYLSGLWPPFAGAIRYLQLWCEYLGLEGQIVSGYRSNQEQARLYAIGRTAEEIRLHVHKGGAGGAVTDAPPGQSSHNYGLGADIEGRDRREIVALAREIGFGTVSWDPNHIEWPNWRALLK